jgi:hypothetical protein
VRSIVVDSAGGVGAFALLPLARAMPPVVSSASRGGLSGVVGDTAFNSLVGAEVRVMGHGESTKTDSVGAFYMPLRPGRYIVSVQQAGYDYRLVSVNIPADSGRRITVFLPPLSRVPSHESANNLTDFEQRLAWRSSMRSRVYTRADLQKLDIEWAYDAVNVAYAALCQGGGCMVDKDCAVIVNGGPETAELASLTVEDIESMEVYLGIQGPPPPALRKAGARGGRGVARWSFPSVPLSNTRIATAKNQARKCLTTYVWLR